MHEELVTCTTFAYGGAAIGRLPDGRAVFVPFALPGETVRVRLTKEKAGYAEAELLDVLTPSPERVMPRCRHFGECGGCHYQHLNYAAQLAAKRQILRDQLIRLGGLADPPVAATVPSPQPWRYRNHMQFHHTPEGRIGFQAARSNQTVAIEECHLPEAPLDAARRELGVRSEGGSVAAQSKIQNLTLKTNREERINLRVGTDGVVQGQGDGPVRMEVLGRKFRVSATSFFQVNTPMAGQMVQHVLAQLESTPNDIVLDLYCGVGLFSAFLAPQVKRVIGVESSPSACADFKVNLAGFDQVELHAGSVEARLPQIKQPVEQVVVDPPRAGLGKVVVEEIIRLAPRALIYVSCDPATLARDARQLWAGAYSLHQVTPFDLFPQTYHIESISVWRRSSER